MVRALVVLLMTAALAAQQPPIDAPAPPPPPFVCDDCPDPTKPWMRGSVEIACTTPDKVEEKKTKVQSHVTVVPCDLCKHRCDPFDPQAEETGGLAWDPQCSTRCSPKGCSCKPPCDS